MVYRDQGKPVPNKLALALRTGSARALMVVEGSCSMGH